MKTMMSEKILKFYFLAETNRFQIWIYAIYDTVYTHLREFMGIAENL